MDKDGLADLLHVLEGSHEPVVFDLETSGLVEHAYTGGPQNGGVAAAIAMATITVGWPKAMVEPTTYVLPLYHPESPFIGQWRKVWKAVAQRLRKIRYVGHHVKFDARYTKATCGVDLSKSLHWDTLLSSSLQDENRSNKLKDVAPQLFGMDRWDDDIDLSYPGAAYDHNLFDLGLYAARDTYWTYRLWKAHEALMFLDDEADIPIGDDEVEDARLGTLAINTSMPTMGTLTAIEQRGIVLDLDMAREMLREAEGHVRDQHDKLARLYSDVPELDPVEASFAPTSKYFARWTEEAVDRGDLRVVSLTKSGKPQWNKAALNRLVRNGYELASDVLDLRDYGKRAEFLRSWQTFVTRQNTIHTTYNAGSVVTGRLSSSSPNMQQVSKKLRPCFVPRPGYVLADLDYSQLEMRVAAHVSQCIPMIEAFQRGDDLHRLFAARINGVEPEEVTGDMRQQAKAGNFGLLFGMGPGGFQIYAETAYNVLLTEEEAAAIHATFFEMWVGMREWHNNMMRLAHDMGQVVSPIGRVRRLPNIHDGNDRQVSDAERQAINSPVQGFGSDIMQMAAASIEGILPGSRRVDGARLVATVHDSIVAEVPEDSWEEVTRECVARMEGVVDELKDRFGVDFAVPLKADASVGTRWGWDDVGEL